MKLSSSWLNRYIRLPKNLDPVLEKLTHRGFEVESVQKVLGGGEWTFELNITPNRPDGMSFLGVARELAPILKSQILTPRVRLQEGKERIQEKVKIKLEAPKKCPRYMARFISGVKIGPSPQWLKTSLELIGQRSINNVVDVTNFVLMEWGQPLHAFDFDQISDATIVIRSAKAQEKIQTLDGQTHTLSLDDLLICDSQKPIALAGIMGGATSEVSESTTSLLLESAYFDPSTIRKTSKKLGLSSESSKRFERGVDIEGVPKALDRAAQLILEVAGGTLARGAIDLYPKKLPKHVISFRKERLEQYLGYTLPWAHVKKHLQTLGFKIKNSTSAKMNVEVPSYRVDVTQQADLIEEIARSEGYDKIPTVELRGAPHLEQHIEKDASLIERVKSCLKGAGFFEVINYSFYSPLDLKKIKWQGPFTQIQNPLGEDFSVMRPTLIPSLLKNLKLNLNHQHSSIRLFELRPVYDHRGQETKMLAGLISGTRTASHWALKEENVDFYDIKAVVNSLFQILDSHLRDENVGGSVENSYFQSNLSFEIRAGGVSVCRFGKLHPELEEAFDVKQAVYVFELDFSYFEARSGKEQKYYFKPLPKYPPVKRDLSLLIPKDKQVTHAQLVEGIVKQGASSFGPLVYDIQLFDIYEGEAIPAGYKSFAYSITYLSPERTLTDQEVNGYHQQICQWLTDTWQIKIR